MTKARTKALAKIKRLRAFWHKRHYELQVAKGLEDVAWKRLKAARIALHDSQERREG